MNSHSDAPATPPLLTEDEYDVLQQTCRVARHPQTYFSVRDVEHALKTITHERALRERAEAALREATTSSGNIVSRAADRIGLLETAIREIDEAVHSHIDGRDLLEELGPSGWHYCDITVRKNGQDVRYQGDWLKNVWYALRKARAALAPVKP